MNDLLKLVTAEKCEELYLDFGKPPALRLKGDLHVIEGPPLSSHNMQSLLQEIASDQQIEDISQRGELRFIYPFGDGRFRVNASIRGNNLSLKLSAQDLK